MSMNDNESENKDKVIDISQYVHEKSKKRKSKEQIKDILYPKILRLNSIRLHSVTSFEYTLDFSFQHTTTSK